MIKKSVKHCNQCKTTKSLSEYYCHATGVVRGLLCSKCNTGLGLFGDDTGRMKGAISYLNKKHG